MKELLIIICTVIAMFIVGLGVGYVEWGTPVEPTSKLFWIDDNRFHQDSIINCSPIYDEPGNIIGSWIRVSYQDTIIYVECLTSEEKGDWQSFKQSWLQAFYNGTGGRL